MTQGQGEVKVKLNAMNQVAAGSPLTDMGFVQVFCSKYSGVSVTLSLSWSVPFPSFTTKNKSKKNPWNFCQFRCGRGMGSRLNLISTNKSSPYRYEQFTSPKYWYLSTHEQRF